MTSPPVIADSTGPTGAALSLSVSCAIFMQCSECPLSCHYSNATAVMAPSSDNNALQRSVLKLLDQLFIPRCCGFLRTYGFIKLFWSYFLPLAMAESGCLQVLFAVASWKSQSPIAPKGRLSWDPEGRQQPSWGFHLEMWGSRLGQGLNVVSDVAIKFTVLCRVIQRSSA